MFNMHFLQYVEHMKKMRILSHSSNLHPPPTLQSNPFNIWRKLSLPPRPYKAKGSTYKERWHVFFPTQVYLYGVLIPFKGLHAWAAWFYSCLPLVLHLSPTCLSLCWARWYACLPHLIQWEKKKNISILTAFSERLVSCSFSTFVFWKKTKQYHQDTWENGNKYVFRF